MPQSSYINGLTPLRGIAAMLVIFLHFQIFIAPLFAPGASSLTDNLYLMVDLFFVLSGFIMYHVYGSYFTKGVHQQSYVKFMKARFARIYPLHLFTFLFTFCISLIYVFSNTEKGAAFNMFYDNSAVPSQLLMIQAMGTHHEATWNTPSWSISVEWWAYMIFPFMMLFLVRTKAWSRVLIGAFILGGYMLIAFYAQPLFWAERFREMNVPEGMPYPIHTLDVITGPGAFLRCICGFMGGMLAYEGFQKSWGKAWLSKSTVSAGLWMALFTLWHFNVLPHYLAPVFFGLIILSIAYNTGRLNRILNIRSFQFLGNISYSLYLVHMPLLFLFIAIRKVLMPNDSRQLMMGYNFTLTEAWLGFVAFVAATILLASFTYHFIEKPARVYLNRRKAKVIPTRVVLMDEKERAESVVL